MDKKELEKLAHLARISISEEEAKDLQKDMEGILKYASQIQEFVTEKEEMQDKGRLYNVMRPDGEPHESGMYTDELLAQAPETERGYVKVKKILN
jgi:aspartyl-tRNA(Asn)/glutamyl-tRNA(Gln) amidotransferase subunit C